MVLYLISAAIGYLIGSRMRDKKDKLTWTGKFQTGAIFFLVFSMGSRMGANEEVISGLATIGISALTITLVVLACSIASLSIGRRLMGLDRFGRIGGSGEAGAGQAEKVRGGFNKTTLLIVIAAALGIERQEVVFALEAITDPLSLYEPVYSDGGESATVMDQIGDSRNTDEHWLEQIALEEAVSRLDSREKHILALRFYDGRTQMEVAKAVGISQAQVSRLEKNAIRRIKKELNS